MLEGDVFVAGVGLISSVGADFAESVRAVRAGRASFSAVPPYAFLPDEGEEEGEPIVGAPVLFHGHQPGQLLGLFLLAMQDLIRNARLRRRDLARLPIYLALPGDLSLPRNLEMAERFVPLFYARAGIPDPGHGMVFAGGHTGALSALGCAMEAMTETDMDACILGGVDSYFHQESLERIADRLRRSGREGLVPGECAAAVLLERPGAAAERGVAALARVSGMGAGDGPAEAILGAVPPPEPAGCVICDLNGEPSREQQWCAAEARLDGVLAPGAAIFRPCDVLGDVGAATGGVLLGMAVAALKGAATPRAVVCASDEDGSSLAVTLDAIADKEAGAPWP